MRRTARAAVRPVDRGRRRSRASACGGEGGIRTHEVFRLSAFQERRHQPLGHLSGAEDTSAGWWLDPSGLPRRGSCRRPRAAILGRVRHMAPSAQGDLPVTATDSFIIQRMGTEEGPYTLQDLKTMARARHIKATTMVKR